MVADAAPLTHVKEYRFGSISLKTGSFTSDLILWPDRVMENWWRRTGHNLCMEDIKEILINPPARLLIGTGYHGAMSVPDDLISRLEKSGTAVSVAATPQAVSIWNSWLDEEGRDLDAAAGFHLPC